MKGGKMVRDYGKEGQKLDYIWAVLSNLISQEQRDIIGELWESKLGCAKADSHLQKSNISFKNSTEILAREELDDEKGLDGLLCATLLIHD